MKTQLLLCFALLSFKLTAQDNTIPTADSIASTSVKNNEFIHASSDTGEKKKLFKLGHEKGGTVCVNGLEKFEIAFSTHKSLTAIGQLHFYGPLKTEGRVFMIVEEEQDEIKKDRYFGTAVDLTWKSFPAHIGYSIGIDPFKKNLNTTFGGVSAAIYWSDIKAVNKSFHILRTGISVLKLTENLVNYHNEDSVMSTPNVLDYSLFYQMQPIHLNEFTTLYSEGMLRLRKDQSFSELELGIRNEKILENLFGVGVKVNFDDFHFYSISGILRFNISNPNPKHQ
jgi:hypothetical protein